MTTKTMPYVASPQQCVHPATGTILHQTDGAYAAFVHSYGFDPLEWSGFPVVRATRELNMTTWLAQ